jgi:hypothetical protein
MRHSAGGEVPLHCSTASRMEQSVPKGRTGTQNGRAELHSAVEPPRAAHLVRLVRCRACVMLDSGRAVSRRGPTFRSSRRRDSCCSRQAQQMLLDEGSVAAMPTPSQRQMATNGQSRIAASRDIRWSPVGRPTAVAGSSVVSAAARLRLAHRRLGHAFNGRVAGLSLGRRVFAQATQ